MTAVCKVLKKVKNYKSRGAAQQRVLVAKDVLKWMKIITPQSGVYIYKPNIKDKDLEKKAQGKIFKDTVLGCGACQLGSMFIAAVDRFNGLTLHEFECSRDSEMREFLSMFDGQTLLEMENVFEGYDEFNDFLRFSPRERMKLICQNIIRNKGKFKPNELLALTKDM